MTVLADGFRVGFPLCPWRALHREPRGVFRRLKLEIPTTIAVVGGGGTSPDSSLLDQDTLGILIVYEGQLVDD